MTEKMPGTQHIHVGIMMVAPDMMHTRTCFDMVRMTAYEGTRGTDISIKHLPGTVIAQSRNEGAKELIEEGCTHVLFVDSDMRFPPNTLERMLSWGEPIVAANCAKRRRPTGPTARVKSSIVSGKSEPLWPDSDKFGLEQVESVGTGLMLIESDVFLQIDWPWFSMPWMEQHGKHMGEDIFFCLRCAEADIPIQVDHGLSWHVRHTGIHDFSMQDTLAEKDAVDAAGGWDEYVSRMAG